MTLLSDEELARRSWRGMLARCYSRTHHAYARYGGRGIAVCERWRASFEAFLEDMGPRPSKRQSIDRIDNDGDYEPGNCRWATPRQQARNRRNNREITWRGETRTVAGWAEVLGLSKHALRHRLEAGWSIERVLTAPPRQTRATATQIQRREAVRLRERGLLLDEIARRVGIGEATVRRAIREAADE